MEELQRELDVYRAEDPVAGLDAALARDVREGKIKELARKNRDLDVKLQKEARRAAAAAAAADAARLEADELREAIERTAEGPGAAAAELSRVQEASREWQKRGKAAEGRELELKARLEELRRENDRLKNALVREVGDDAPVAKIAAGEHTDWRGRAQQITLLRDKLRELKAQGNTTSVAHAAEVSLPSRAAAYAPAGKHLDKLAASRASADDRRAQELMDAREQVAALKQKLDAATSRRKVLEEGSKDLKASVAKLLAKSDNDDRLIAALKSQVGAGRGGGGSMAAAALAEDRIKHKDAQISRQELIICSLLRQLDSR